MNKVLSSPMIDGFNSGVPLSELQIGGVATSGLDTEITEKEYNFMVTTLSALPNAINMADKGWRVTVALDHTFTILGVSKSSSAYWFNVRGNPISFMTGQNVLGVVDLVDTVAAYYRAVSQAVQRLVPDFRMPLSIKRNVDNLQVYIHGLAFAAYTHRLGLPDAAKLKYLLDGIDHIYSHAVPDFERSTLKQQLEVRLTREGDYSMRFDKMSGKNRYWSLALYSKWHELSQQDGSPADWLQDRLRLDLTLHNEWFKANAKPTLAAIHDKYGHDLKAWVIDLFNHVLTQLQLRYVLSFRVTNLDKGKYADWFADWLHGNNEKPTVACLEWFRRQGLNVKLGAEFHGIAGKARATFTGTGEDAKLATFGDAGAQERLGSSIRDGFNNPKLLPVLKRAHLLMPDAEFGSYVLSDAGDYIDNETGEVLS